MRLLPALTLCLLTACATKPAVATPEEDDDLAPEGATAGMKDEKSAEEICAGGAGDMCSALADHTFRKAKTDEQRKKALSWAIKGCELKDGAGCSLAGWAHEWGKTGEPNFGRALESYGSGCAIKDGRSCVKAATLLSYGPVSLRDRAKAKGFAAKACGELRDEDGCALDAKLKAEPVGSTVNQCGKKGGEGTLSREDISTVIRWHAPEVRDCFDRALQRDSKLAGRVEASWVIDCAGAVTKLKPAESTLPPAVTECVLGNVKLWRFPAPAGGGTVNITFPWVLKPTAAAQK